MATHSSVLALRIQGWGSLVGCRLWGHTELDTTEVTCLAAAAHAKPTSLMDTWSFPWWLRRSSICLQCRKPRFSPWIGKIPWTRKWQPTPVFLPGDAHGQRSLVGYNPWACQESDTPEANNTLLYNQETEQHLHFLLRAHEYSAEHTSDL